MIPRRSGQNWGSSIGTAVAAVWALLDRDMEIFLDLFGAQKVAYLLGDREFVGSEWFRFLKRHRIKFQMRLHRDTLVRSGRGQYVQAWRMFCRTRIKLLSCS
jgi:hypothetical protein